MVHCMSGWVWRPEREMMGWELGGRLDVLPENEDDGKDIEPEAFSTTHSTQKKQARPFEVSTMGRRSPSTSHSLHWRKKEATYHTTLDSHGQKKLVLVERLQAKFRQETSSPAADKKQKRWRDATRIFQDAGPQIKDKKVAWQMGLKES